MGIFSSPCPFPYGESPYGNGEGSFDAPLSHARITQILEFWVIQRAPLLTKNYVAEHKCKRAPLLTKNR